MNNTPNRNALSGMSSVLLTLAGVAVTAILLRLLYALPLTNSFLWFAGIFVYYVIPGNLMLRFLGFRTNDCCTHLVHATALGASIIPLMYSLCRLVALPWLVSVFAVALVPVWLVISLRAVRGNNHHAATAPGDVLALLLLTAAVVFLLHLSHFTDVIFLENGFLHRINDLTETEYHHGLIANLRELYPPLYPYTSGTGPFQYHLLMHLSVEMMNRFLSVDTLQLTYFYFPLLYFWLLATLPYLFFRTFYAVRLPGALAGMLMFGAGLSFIPGFAGLLAPQYPWTGFFKTTIWSLFTLNGYLPSLFVMLLSFLYLKKYLESGKTRFIAVFALLGYAAYGFKSSMGYHLMAGLFMTGLVMLLSARNRYTGTILCAVSAGVSIVMAADVMLLRQGAGHFSASISLFHDFRTSLQLLGYSDMPRYVYPAVYLLYVLALLGVRALGFCSLRGRFKKQSIDITVIFLAIFGVSGIIVSELFFVGIASGEVNNAVWFGVQSLAAMWILVAYVILDRIREGNKCLVYCLAVALLSFPSTAQFLSLRFSPGYYYYDASAVEVINYLGKTDYNTVVLAPPNFKVPSLAANFAGRQSVYSHYHAFVSQTRGKAEADSRLSDLARFFTAPDLHSMVPILNKYNVDYVYATLNYADRLDSVPVMTKVLQNEKYVLYAVQ